jgi:hypothetical protein
MDSDALPAAMSSPLVSQAVRELMMLSQTDIERERYESRRKAQLDYNSDIKAARSEGKIEAIHFCERLLRRPETPAEQLLSLSLEELSKIVNDLQSQVLSRQ